MKAWELLEEKGWCQGSFARNKEGKGVSPGSSEACSFCLVGALCASGNLDKLDEIAKVTYKKFSLFPFMWNDRPGRTKEEVVKLLKELDI